MDFRMDAHSSAHDANHHLITVSGAIDLATFETLITRLHTLIGPCPRQVVLDLTPVTFIDCTGLRALLTVDRQVRSAGGTLLLAAVSPAVAFLLKALQRLGELPDIPALRAGLVPHPRVPT